MSQSLPGVFYAHGEKPARDTIFVIDVKGTIKRENYLTKSWIGGKSAILYRRT